MLWFDEQQRTFLDGNRGKMQNKNQVMHDLKTHMSLFPQHTTCKKLDSYTMEYSYIYFRKSTMIQHLSGSNEAAELMWGLGWHLCGMIRPELRPG